MKTVQVHCYSLFSSCSNVVRWSVRHAVLQPLYLKKMAATLPNARRVGYADDGNVETIHTTHIQKSRRQWNIQDSPRGLLRRMRSQLAEDGDPESQLVLAKALLDPGDEDLSDAPEDAPRQAVFWLTRASLQGHDEATALLQRCLDTDTGISEHNYHEVRQCLTMERQEKLARRAALHLFTSLSDGNDFVTSSMLTTRIRGVLQGKGQAELEKKEKRASSPEQDEKGPTSGNKTSLETRYGGERFLEEHLTAAATSYHQGYLPPLHHFLPSFDNDLLQQQSGMLQSDQISSSRCRSAISYITSLIGLDRLHSAQGHVPRFQSRVIRYLGMELIRKVKYWYYGLSSGKVVMLLLMLFCFVSVTGKDNLVSLFPWIALCLSILGMAVASSTILVNYKHLDEFKVWSVVLKHHCSELSTETAEYKFRNRWYVPFIGMFMALFAYLSFKPFVPNWLLCLQIPFFIFFGLLTLTCSINRVGIMEHIPFCFYLAANTLNSLSSTVLIDYIKNSSPTSFYPYIKWISSVETEYMLSNSLKLFLGFNSFFHIFWIITVAVCFFRKGWLSTATLLVASSWWNLTLTTVLSLSSTTAFVYSAIIWVVVAILPVVWEAVSLVFLVSCLAILCLQLGAGGGITAGCAVSYLIIHYSLQKFYPKLFRIMKLVVFWVAMCGLLLINARNAPVASIKRSNLKWEYYQNVCVPSRETEAQSFIACRHLEGLLVNWQGKLIDSKVTSFTNWPEYIIEVLPLPEQVKNILSCQIGDEVNICNRTEMPLVEYERCVVVAAASTNKERCSLHFYNHFTLSLSVAMDDTYWKLSKESINAVLRLDATHSKRVLRMTVGEKVEFEGVLTAGVGTKIPVVTVTQIKCSNCKEESKVTESKALDYSQPAVYLEAVLTSICNYFLGPTVILR